jgi:hypothetical protein
VPVLLAQETAIGRVVRLRIAHPLVAFTLLAVLATAVAALAALDTSALCLLPTLALAAPLMLRRYPGVRALARLAAPRPGHQRAPSSARLRWRGWTTMPRGGLLMARALAVRPPPRAALTAS